MIKAFIDRLATYILLNLISLDQWIQTAIKGLWWWLTGRGSKPDPDETISGLLGRHVAKGAIWAIFPAAVVDAIFVILTFGKERQHCWHTHLNEKGAGTCPAPSCPIGRN